MMMGRSTMLPHAEIKHGSIAGGVWVWCADVQSCADALVACGVVDTVTESLLADWHSLPNISAVAKSSSLVETVLQAARKGTFMDTTTLVLHWVWSFADACLPLHCPVLADDDCRSRTASGGAVAAWPSGHRPYFQDSVAAEQPPSMPQFLWQLARCMPQLTRVHLIGGGHCGMGCSFSAPHAAADMHKWRNSVNTCGVFTAGAASVPPHWTSPRRPAPLRWLGDFGDTAGAGIDLAEATQQVPMHPHVRSIGDSRDATGTDMADVLQVPGVHEALPLGQLQDCLQGTNGLWRELLLTAYLPPAPPAGTLGARLLELHLHNMVLSSRDVAALPLLFPCLRFLRLHYCHGYSRLAMEAAAEHFSDCKTALLGGISMYRCGAADRLEDWSAGRQWTAFLGSAPVPVHSCLAGTGLRRLIPRATSAIHGPWSRRGAALMCRAAHRSGTRGGQAAARGTAGQRRGDRRVSGPVLLALAALRIESDQAICPSLASRCAKYVAVEGGVGGSHDRGEGSQPLWWWRASHAEECLLGKGSALLRCVAAHRSLPYSGAAADASSSPLCAARRQLLRLAATCGLRCTASRADTLLQNAACVDDVDTLGYAVLDHDRDELSGGYWPVAGDWRKGGMGWPKQEPNPEAGWMHFWNDPR